MGFGKGRIGIYLAVLCGLAVLILFYLSMRPLLTPAMEEDATERGATFLGGRYEGWEGTKQSWLLEAAEIYRPTDGQKVTFRGIHRICFFQEDGHNLVLKAASATLDLKRNSLTLIEVGGEVGGGRLYADKMELDLDKNQVSCAPPLSFTKERLIVQAERMEGNFQTGEYCFSGDLEVVQKDHRIRGHSFIYQANADRFEIRGAVEVELTL